MQEDESDEFDGDLHRKARRQDRLFAVLTIAVLVVVIVPVAIFMVYRNLTKGARSYARQAVGSERSQTVKKQVTDPAAGRSGKEPQIVNVVRSVTNVIEKRVDVMVERKMTNYVDKVVTVTNYVDKVVDVVVVRTNEIERQVSLPTSPETNDDLFHETNESKRQIEQALAELAEEMDVGADEPSVPVTNVVERKVDVEVVRLVTNYVDRPVEVEVNRPVTNIMERIVEVAVDRFETNWVDRPVTVNLDRFVTNIVERKVDVVVERPLTNFIDRIVDVPVDHIVTNLVRRPVDVYVDVPVTNVIERLVEVVMTNEVRRPVMVYVERPVTNYVERKTQVLVDRPVQAAARVPKVRRPVRLTTPYRVKSGETVGGLAKRYGFQIPDFRVYNPRVDINRISIGQMLNLPGDVDVSR